MSHGEWLPYLEQKVEFTRQTANQFIRCYEEFGNVTSTLHLPIGHMFELLSLSPEPRKEFIAENEVTSMTQKQLREAIKAQKEAEQRAEKLQEELEIATEDITVLKQSNRELYEQTPKDYEVLCGENTALKLQVETQKLELMQEDSALFGLATDIENFVKEHADVVFLRQQFEETNEVREKRMHNALYKLESWIAAVRGANQIIEGEVV